MECLPELGPGREEAEAFIPQLPTPELRAAPQGH